MRCIFSFALLPVLCQGALLTTPTKASPLVAKKANQHVHLSVEQQQHMHSGCVDACRPSPVESKCVTACEAAMYKCIDETGPNETPKDTAACEAKVLKHYKETKGIEKKEEKKAEKGDAKKEGKKEDKKAEKKAKSFLQVRNIDDDNAEAAEMARLEAQSDKDMGEDDDETSKADDSSDDEDKSDDEESFVQVKRNIDDENAEAAEMARLEAQSDKDMGEDDDETSKSDDNSDDDDKSDDEESFVQTNRNIDDENAEAAEMARLEAQSDKDMGEDDDETSKSDDSTDDEDKSEDDESFVQVKRNIDDENAEAAEMARLEAQSDKDMGEDDDETSKADDSSDDEDKSEDEDSFVQVKRNIDDENAEAAEMARLEAQSDKDMGEDDDETSKSDDSTDDEDKSDDDESFVQVTRNIDDENAEAAEMARLEAQSDKDMGEDDDETSKSDDSSDDEDKSDDEDSFVQVKRNIDDDNAEAAEMARLEAQSDKDMGEDDDEGTTTDSTSDDANDDGANTDDE